MRHAKRSETSRRNALPVEPRSSSRADSYGGRHPVRLALRQSVLTLIRGGVVRRCQQQTRRSSFMAQGQDQNRQQDQQNQGGQNQGSQNNQNRQQDQQNQGSQNQGSQN